MITNGRKKDRKQL